MTKDPKILSEALSLTESDRTDVLGDVFDALRLVPVIHGQLVLGAPWGIAIDDPELMHFYVVARGLVWVESRGRKPFTASAGDVLVFPSGARHVLRDAPGSPVVELNPKVCRGHPISREPRRKGGTGPESMLVAGGFRMLAASSSALIERLPEVLHLSSGDESVNRWLKPLVDLVLAEVSLVHPGGGVVLSRLADVLLIQALRALSRRRECAASPLRAVNDLTIGRALGLMHSRPEVPWTVNRLATKVGVSRSGFAARFSSLVGESPLHYLARWRMTRAAQLLRETDEPMPAVAAKVGYASDAAFNRAFKRAHGHAPGAFRRAGA